MLNKIKPLVETSILQCFSILTLFRSWWNLDKLVGSRGNWHIFNITGSTDPPIGKSATITASGLPWPTSTRIGVLGGNFYFFSSVFSERSLYAIAVPSVVCLSVTLVRPTQPVEIFGNFSSPFGTLAIHWHPRKILRRSSQGHPSVEG